MTAFAAALDLLFADPNLGQEAWHRDSEGQFTRIRIIARQKDPARVVRLAGPCVLHRPDRGGLGLGAWRQSG